MEGIRLARLGKQRLDETIRRVVRRSACLLRDQCVARDNRRHFILAHNKDVLRPSFRRGFEGLLQAEVLVSEFDDQIVMAQLAGESRRLQVRAPAEGCDVNIWLAYD